MVAALRYERDCVVAWSCDHLCIILYASVGLMERIKDGETVICAEGYLFHFERMGYLKAGPFTPEVVVDHPELVRQLYKDFVRAGSDVVQAFTVSHF